MTWLDAFQTGVCIVAVVTMLANSAWWGFKIGHTLGLEDAYDHLKRKGDV